MRTMQGVVRMPSDPSPRAVTLASNPRRRVAQCVTRLACACPTRNTRRYLLLGGPLLWPKPSRARGDRDGRMLRF